jgi:tetratricopeptide (TPR) repeat protein
MTDREPRLGNVAEVANAIQLAAQDGKSLGRTVFFIGAGCSVSAGIPLVSDMARTLTLKLARAKHAPAEALRTADDAYHWLSSGRGFADCRDGEAPEDGAPETRVIDWPRVYDVLFAQYYKTPDHAREIFSELVDQSGGRINWAHLCLGELVKQRLVSTVLTTNFDQLTLAGLVRSGVLPVVCDGTESLTRIRGAPLHPQLIELHGSRHTYRLRNAPEEIEALISDSATIAAIESLFQDLRVFIAVGYGGREKGVMELLIRAASRFTDKQVFWIVHGNDPTRISDNAGRLLATSRNAALVLGQDADSFFVRLLKDLGIGAPEAVREPLFLANLHASSLASHHGKEIADGAAIVEEIDRHREEIGALGRALTDHREARTAAGSALVKAREFRLAGKLSEAFLILQQASRGTEDQSFWLQFAEAAFEFGEICADREPLEIAVAAWDRVLAMTDRAQDSRGWAAAQNNLGNALVRLGDRESGTARLHQAVTAFREALKEYTRELTPLEWAMTQNNLANALQSLGERERGTARLDEAVTAYREALKEYTRARAPLDWAMTQNNLGNALATLGTRKSGTDGLDEAVIAYREALKEWKRERVPLDWAMTQNNLGTALRTLATRESGTARLEEAIAAYREGLKEWTRERVPLEWAATQNNLGNALATLGERESGTARFEEAIAAYREALKERTPERVPLDWAMTQNNLGNALATLGLRESGTTRFDEAVAAYREALKERTRERVPLDWALTQNNLGNVLRALGTRESGTARLDEAVAAYREALKVLEDSGADHYAGIARDNLKLAEAELAKRRSPRAPKSQRRGSPRPSKRRGGGVRP